jgi:hypothetical protein
MLKIRTGGAAAVVLAAATCAHAQDAVEWRVEDGGNGHWYSVLGASSSISWGDARDLAVSRGGFLAAITTAEEAAFIREYLEAVDEWWVVAPRCCSETGPYLGGFRESLDADWQWVNGDEWGEEFFCFNQPSGAYCEEQELVLHAKRGSLCDMNYWWGDIPESGICGSEVPGMRHYLAEWSADCNGDGIVDYGQILDGTYADEDGNGVPDCCDAGVPCDCPADLNGDGMVGPPDLGILLALWSTDGMPNGADINGDKTVNAADLGLLIGAWGDCG